LKTCHFICLCSWFCRPVPEEENNLSSKPGSSCTPGRKGKGTSTKLNSRSRKGDDLWNGNCFILPCTSM